MGNWLWGKWFSYEENPPVLDPEENVSSQEHADDKDEETIESVAASPPIKMRRFQTKADKKKAPQKKNTKGKRQWGEQITQEEVKKLNFSKDDVNANSNVEKFDYAQMKNNETAYKPKGESWFSKLAKMTKNIVECTLTDAHIDPIIEDVQNHLASKNVSTRVLDAVCDQIRSSLLGIKCSRFENITSHVRKTTESIFRKVLECDKIDLLQDIKKINEKGNTYVIAFVGVNGVGKSTSLSKVCAFLVSQGFSVMMAACDSFRSGAIEQLNIHSTRLGVPLFKKDYGTSPSSIATMAIKKANDEKLMYFLLTLQEECKTMVIT